MPKLTLDQIIIRLQGRIAQLEANAQIANKDIRALLTDTQEQALDIELARQVEFKKGKRARTEEEKKQLGWKTIREVRLEVLRSALAEADDGLPDDLKRRAQAAEVRRSKIYLEAYFKARNEGKDKHVAENWANNELTRANLSRLDGQVVEHERVKNNESAEMEEALREHFKSKMTAEELEQYEMAEKLENGGKVGKVWGVGKAKE
jgi:hypothetical protein